MTTHDYVSEAMTEPLADDSDRLSAATGCLLGLALGTLIWICGFGVGYAVAVIFGG